MQRIARASKDVLTEFVLDHVQRDGEIRTDAWCRLWRHRRHRRVASLLKRWLVGTHQGAVGHEQLDFSLDEFTFRFNRRHARHRGMLFYRLLQQAVATEPHPLNTLYTEKPA